MPCASVCIFKETLQTSSQETKSGFTSSPRYQEYVGLQVQQSLRYKCSTEYPSQGQFLAYEKPKRLLKAPELSDSCFNIARVKNLSASISVPAKQHLIQENVFRENDQILGHVVWLKIG